MEVRWWPTQVRLWLEWGLHMWFREGEAGSGFVAWCLNEAIERRAGITVEDNPTRVRAGLGGESCRQKQRQKKSGVETSRQHVRLCSPPGILEMGPES